MAGRNIEQFAVIDGLDDKPAVGLPAGCRLRLLELPDDYGNPANEIELKATDGTHHA